MSDHEPAATGCACTPAEFGVKGDGATDDTAALQAYVDHMVAQARPDRAHLGGPDPSECIGGTHGE